MAGRSARMKKERERVKAGGAITNKSDSTRKAKDNFKKKEEKTITTDIPAITKPAISLNQKEEKPGFLDKAKQILTGDLKTGFDGEPLLNAKGEPVGDVLAGTVPITPVGVFASFVPTSKIAKAAQVGKPVVSALSKSGKTASIASRFATTARSLGLTRSFIIKLGIATGAAGTLLGAIGTYPFAGFIKEEAIQNIGIASEKAITAGDDQGAEQALRLEREIITNGDRIIDKVPYANVVIQLKAFFKAAEKNLDLKERRFTELKADRIGEGQFTSVYEQAAKDKQTQFDENTAQIKARDAEFKQSEEDRNKRQDKRDAAFKENQAINAEIDILESNYFALVREKKFNEADEVQIKLNKLRESLT